MNSESPTPDHSHRCQSRWRFRWLSLVMVLLCGVSGMRLDAAQDAAQITELEIGFGGRYKVGHWTPVRITVQAGQKPLAGRLTLTTPDSDGVPVALHDEIAAPVEIAAGQQRTIESYVRMGRRLGAITVEFADEKNVYAQRTFTPGEFPTPLPSTQRLIVTLGSPIGIEATLQSRLRNQAANITAIELPTAEGLPTDWFGYLGIDTAVVTTSGGSVLETMTEQQFAAFDRWLKLGGRMVLCAGSRGEELFAAEQRLARFSPGREVRTINQRDTTALESFCGAKQSLESAAAGGRTRRFSIRLTAVDQVHGAVDVSERGEPFGRLPIIIRSPYGLGRVDFVAVDLDQPPFTQWLSQTTLIAKIVFRDVPEKTDEDDDSERVRSITHVGYEDLIGQLRSALDQFAGVTRVEFSWVASLLVVYILLIGPADYLLLKRLNRMHATWLTFPVIVVAFAVLAVMLSARLSGNRLHLNQLEIVDVDTVSGQMRGLTWTHLYSPTDQAFDLTLVTEPVSAKTAPSHAGQLFSWQGLPGTGLGGFDTTAAAALFARPYELIRTTESMSEAMTIRNMPIQVGSSKSLGSLWWAETDRGAASRLATDRHGLLTGEFTNPLAVELNESLLMFENWVYRVPGKLAPGQSIQMSTLVPLNLEWRLTRRRLVDTKDVTTPWDPLSQDIPRIAEAMMFFAATGGDSYTSLTHRYQPYIDLSEHLRTGRAVLVGRSDQHAAHVSRDGRLLAADYDQHWTFCRIVFPVDRLGAAR